MVVGRICTAGRAAFHRHLDAAFALVGIPDTVIEAKLHFLVDVAGEVVGRHPAGVNVDGREAAFDIHTSWVTPDDFPGYVEQEVQFRFDNGVWNAHQRKRGVEITVEGRSPGEYKYTPNHHYNATFVEPWGQLSQRGYGLEVIRRFFEEVAFVEFGGPPDGRGDRLRGMSGLAYNDLSADRPVVATVQAMEAILRRHAEGQPRLSGGGQRAGRRAGTLRARSGGWQSALRGQGVGNRVFVTASAGWTVSRFAAASPPPAPAGGAAGGRRTGRAASPDNTGPGWYERASTPPARLRRRRRRSGRPETRAIRRLPRPGSAAGGPVQPSSDGRRIQVADDEGARLWRFGVAPVQTERFLTDEAGFERLPPPARPAPAGIGPDSRAAAGAGPRGRPAAADGVVPGGARARQATRAGLAGGSVLASKVAASASFGKWNGGPSAAAECGAGSGSAETTASWVGDTTRRPHPAEATTRLADSKSHIAGGRQRIIGIPPSDALLRFRNLNDEFDRHVPILGKQFRVRLQVNVSLVVEFQVRLEHRSSGP